MTMSRACLRAKYVAIIFAMSAFIGQSLFAAGSGTIKGKILDKLTGEELIGANVIVVGTSLGASSDLDGSFVIHNVPIGERTIKISYVGYLPISEQIVVPENGVIEKEFRLTPQPIQGQEVTVTAQARGQNEAINQQLASTTITNVVSSEKMKELPDANIAESIGRLPGITLQRNAGEANAVVVRGLSPKYNEVTIEGVPMISTNYQDRGIDLSLIGDDLVKGVEVSKTLQPNMDADALGGTVNLTLKTAQEGFHFDVRGNGGYTKLNNSYNNYKIAATVSDRFLSDKIGLQVQGSVEGKQLPSDQFNASYALPQSYVISPGDTIWNLSTQNATTTRTQTIRNRYSISAILDYTSDLVDIKFYNVYDQKRDSTLTRSNQDRFTSNDFMSQIFETVTKTEQRTHSLQFLFKIGTTELPISLSYTKGDVSAPGQQFDIYGQENPIGYSPLTVGATNFTQPSTLMNHMGTQQPGYSSLQTIYETNTTLTDEQYDAKLDWKVPFKLSDFISGSLSVGGKYHNINRTSDYAYHWLYYQFGQGAGTRGNLAAYCGSLDPNFSTNLSNQEGIDAHNFTDPNFTSGSVLGYTLGPQYNMYQLLNMQNGYYAKNSNLYYTNAANDYGQTYTDKENTRAGYIMGEFNFGSSLTIVPGARFQEERSDIQAYHILVNGLSFTGLASPVVPVEFITDNPNWYPSVNIKYKATDNIQVFGAAYRSASLPSFIDLSPMVIFNSPSLTSGNPYLKPATATNFDLGASIFNNDIGLFTVNVFYKEISNLIYSMVNYRPFNHNILPGAPADILSRLPQTTNNFYDTSFANTFSNKLNISTNIPMNDPDQAYLRGIELSWQTHLWYLPWVLSGVVLDLNVSFMNSQQTYPYFKVVTQGAGIHQTQALQYLTTSGPLQDQPKATYNAILGWDYKGFSARVSFRYQEVTLTSLDTQYPVRDAYYDNVFLTDISVKQQIFENLAIFADVTNLNTHIDSYYLNYYNGNNGTSGQLPTSQQTYGMIAQLGLSFNY